MESCESSTRLLLRRQEHRPRWGRVLAALVRAHTYSPWQNDYARVGLLLALPGVLLALSQSRDPAVVACAALVCLLAYVMAGVVGTLRHRSDEHLGRLIDKLDVQIAQLVMANNDLTCARKQAGRFMADVTHDLKAPLVAIRGYSELILQESYGPVTPRQRNGLRVALRNVERLQRLIRDLLEFERIEGGDLRLEPSDFELEELIRDVLDSLEPSIVEKGLHVEFRSRENLRVRGDREKIGRVMLNLLSNSVKFSPPGSVLAVVLDDSTAVERAVVSIEDHGPGMPPATDEGSFTRFCHRDVGGKRSEGSGLGLTICKRILEAHGSSLGLASVPGAGTTARFSIALAPAIAVPASAP